MQGKQPTELLVTVASLLLPGMPKKKEWTLRRIGIASHCHYELIAQHELLRARKKTSCKFYQHVGRIANCITSANQPNQTRTSFLQPYGSSSHHVNGSLIALMSRPIAFFSSSIHLRGSGSPYVKQLGASMP